jgi:uncharacterized protein (DUF927 family)
MLDRDPMADLDRLNAEEAGAGTPGDGASSDPREVEIARLAALPFRDYQAERKDAAVGLDIGLGALDKAVRAEQARLRGLEARQHRMKAPPAPGEVRWPAGWAMKADGLYGPASGDAPPPWIAAPFEVLGETRDQAGEEWGVWLRWRDGDGMLHTYAMPHALVMVEPGRLEAELVCRGLRVSADPATRMMLRRGLGEVRTGSRVRVAYATGWQGDTAVPAFLLPDGTVLGKAAEAVVLHNPAADAAQRCGIAGTLEGWKAEVAALAAGNPLPVFCIAAALAGPLLHLAGDAGGGFHLYGGSKRGKTLALQMGLSVWALPYKAGGALRDWRSTANALEAAGEECTDGLLTLDELHQANPAEVAAACYMLADGAGKGRLKRDASAARRRTWRAFVLSTGEHDLATAVARAGQKFPAGAEVRLPSIPVGDVAEAWPALHGRADLSALGSAIHQALHRQHGTAARAFIERLAAERARDPAGLVAFLEAMRARFTARLPPAADPQVRDVARRCALVATAGELAARWGIVPWPAGEAETATGALLAAWVARRAGGAGAAETAAQLERVRTALVQHGAGRFTVLFRSDDESWYEEHPERPVLNRIGWRKRDGERDEYLIPSETWRAEICTPAGLDPAETARTLAASGYLRRGGDRNLMARERLPGMGALRVYAISAALLETAGDGEGRGA